MRAIIATLALVMLFAAGGCASARGGSAAEKRQYVLQMRDQALADLYAQRPEARAVVEGSPGYGVFSNVGAQIIFVSSDHGFGVVTKRAGGTPTFMSMAGLGAGLGVGARDVRAVFVFRDEETLEKFISEGWEWGAHGAATAKYAKDGGEAEAVDSFEKDVIVYQFTENGIMAGGFVRGTKYWRDKELSE